MVHSLDQGLFGFEFIGPKRYPALQLGYWRGIAEALTKMGCQVIVARVPACSSIEIRANELLKLPIKSSKVNFIAHSMVFPFHFKGGLDARFLISKLQPSFKISSLTTMGCPHRGSSFADWLHEKTPQELITNWLSQISIDISGIQNLTTSFLREFNRFVPNSSSVAYYSFAAKVKENPPPLLRIPYNIVSQREGDNDGVVSVESAKWGNFVQVLDASHFDLVNTWSPTKREFDAINLYMKWADTLYSEGH